MYIVCSSFFFFQAEDGIRDLTVTGVQTCALPICLNPELGTEADFSALQEGLQKRGMGLLVDIVPNHMSASSENAWWMDVLENGPESAYASYFDIDWHPPSRSLERKILLPVLGRPFGE